MSQTPTVDPRRSTRKTPSPTAFLPLLIVVAVPVLALVGYLVLDLIRTRREARRLEHRRQQAREEWQRTLRQDKPEG